MQKAHYKSNMIAYELNLHTSVERTPGLVVKLTDCRSVAFRDGVRKEGDVDVFSVLGVTTIEITSCNQ